MCVEFSIFLKNTVVLIRKSIRFAKFMWHLLDYICDSNFTKLYSA